MQFSVAANTSGVPFASSCRATAALYGWDALSGQQAGCLNVGMASVPEGLLVFAEVEVGWSWSKAP